MELCKIRKIIVRMPNWIGDLVMALPILEDLRKHYPQAEITAMCQANIAQVLYDNPHIDELFSFKKAEGVLRRIRDRNVTFKLKKGQYDLGILLTNSFSSAWLFWQGGVKNKLGFRGNGRSFLLDYSITFPEDKKTTHLVATYKRLLAPLGIPVSETPPHLFLKEEEIEGIWKFVKRFDISKEQKIIGINPGAAYGSAKCWPPERFTEIARKMVEHDPSCVVVFVGDLSQKSLVAKICTDLPKSVINLSGQTTLRELIALIKICTVFLTNDSGPMHIASSVETPLIALFGSTDPVVTGPYEKKEGVIRKPVPCSPCFLRECPIDFPCMKKIEVNEVFDALLNLLEKEQLVLR